MKPLILAFIFFLCDWNVKAESWKSVLSPSGMTKVSSPEIKFGFHAYAKIAGWLRQNSDVSSPDEKAWELMGDRSKSEIEHILDLIDLDMVERELMKEIEARRDVFRLSLVQKNTIKEYGTESDIVDILKLRSSIIARIEKYRALEKK